MVGAFYIIKWDEGQAASVNFLKEISVNSVFGKVATKRPHFVSLQFLRKEEYKKSGVYRMGKTWACRNVKELILERFAKKILALCRTWLVN